MAIPGGTGNIWLILGCTGVTLTGSKCMYGVRYLGMSITASGVRSTEYAGTHCLLPSSLLIDWHTPSSQSFDVRPASADPTTSQPCPVLLLLGRQAIEHNVPNVPNLFACALS